MNYYRVTKYSPAYRDERGFYTRDEWTSYSDIGKTFSGVLLTKTEYLKAEKRYISFCIDLWRLAGSKPLKICDLETILRITIPETITDEKELSFVVQAVLREKCWFKLKRYGFFIHFGYDYYMYVGTMIDEKTVIELAREKELFCEPMKSPYL